MCVLIEQGEKLSIVQVFGDTNTIVFDKVTKIIQLQLNSLNISK